MLVTRPTQIFRSFLTNSAAHGTSDKNQQQFAWLLGGCGLAAFLFTLITSKSAATAATAMAGAETFFAFFQPQPNRRACL